MVISSLKKTAQKMLTVMFVALLIQGNIFPQDSQSTGQAEHKNLQTISTEQLAQIKAILAQYNPATLTADDAKAIHAKFREAGIHGGSEIREAIISAGFDPEKLRSLAPPPSDKKAQKSNKDLPENRLIKIETEIITPLSLDSAQTATVKGAFVTFFAEVERLKMSQVNPKEHLDKSVIEPIEKARDEKISAVLSKEQFAKYLELEKVSRASKNKNTDTQSH